MAKQFIPEATWLAIEAEYRAGVRRLTDISKTYGVKGATIAARANRQGWTRDLVTEVKKRTEEKLAYEALGRKPRTTQELLEREKAIDAAATMHVQVIQRHKDKINKANAVCDGLLEELALQGVTQEDFQQIAELLAWVRTQDDPNEDFGKLVAEDLAARWLKSWNKVLSLENRVDTMKKLADTLKTMITLERLVCGISDNANGDADKPADGDILLTDREAARRVAFILTKATKQPSKEVNPDGN